MREKTKQNKISLFCLKFRVCANTWRKYVSFKNNRFSSLVSNDVLADDVWSKKKTKSIFVRKVFLQHAKRFSKPILIRYYQTEMEISLCSAIDFFSSRPFAYRPSSQSKVIHHWHTRRLYFDFRWKFDEHGMQRILNRLTFITLCIRFECCKLTENMNKAFVIQMKPKPLELLLMLPLLK